MASIPARFRAIWGTNRSSTRYATRSCHRHALRACFGTEVVDERSRREHVIENDNQSAAYEIDSILDRHEIDDGAVSRRERLDVFSAVPVRFSERVLRALGREQDARLGKREPSPLVRGQSR